MPDAFNRHLSRRDFLKALVGVAVAPVLLANPAQAARQQGVWVNDVHSQLNATRVHEVVRPDSVAALQDAVLRAGRGNLPICVAGGRHAMGGQQFATGALLVDTGDLDRVLALDAEKGTLRVEAGAQWPHVIDAVRRGGSGWTIRQKPTGTDDISIGGSMAANIHGRGLTFPPMISDILDFDLVNAQGERVRCSRTENPELFRLAIGGYGLFGVVAAVTLQLVPRQKVRRFVQMVDIDALVPTLEREAKRGALYGDYQFAIDPADPAFLTRGILSYYKPVQERTAVPDVQKLLSVEAWKELVHLAHTDKKRAFEKYAAHYLETDGQLYWSDTHQLGPYRDNYHELLDGRLAAGGTEMITEIYVPRALLPSFMRRVRDDFRLYSTDLIYGTIRLIEPDRESFLAWARQPYACVIFNLHTPHSPVGLYRSAEAFRRLIDRAIAFEGSYYLTYHRWARRDQVLACYPEFPEFLRRKRVFDPQERFQSTWYRHYRTMFADLLRK